MKFSEHCSRKIWDPTQKRSHLRGRDFLEHCVKPGAAVFPTESPQRLLVDNPIKESWLALHHAETLPPRRLPCCATRNACFPTSTGHPVSSLRSGGTFLEYTLSFHSSSHAPYYYRVSPRFPLSTPLQWNLAQAWSSAVSGTWYLLPPLYARIRPKVPQCLPPFHAPSNTNNNKKNTGF